jgi:hypothetical protein
MNDGGRIALIITGAIASLIAVALVAGGGLALWGNSLKDDDGYLRTDTGHFSANSRALATDNLDVDLGDADFIADSEDLAKITVSAESRDGKPVFVGIARTSDVERYLAGVPYTTVNDIDVDPFSADYERHSGHRHPVSPENAGIWVDSSQGTGKQTINPKLDDGDYSVVVMNADGSLGVDADVSAGAKIPFLDELAWSAIGSGAFALILGIGLIALAARKTRTAVQ